MDCKQMFLGRRSIRRFDENKNIPSEVLEEIVKVGSYAANACNLQAFDYLIVMSEEQKEKVFPHLKWAISIENYAPPPGNRPNAYIVPLIDEERVKQFGRKDIPADALRDAHYISLGCSISNIINYAYSLGIATCIIGAINQNGIRTELNIEGGYTIPLVIALGYGAEFPKIREVGKEDATTYFVEEGQLIIPKRTGIVRRI